jgi:hypothetical protein
MNQNHQRPDMVLIFFDELKSDWQNGGLRRLLPWVMILCGCAGFAGGYYVDGDLFSKAQWQSLTALYAGVLTFNAITLALTWSAIGKMYDTLSDPEFSRFLRVSGVLNHYSFYIWVLHLIQILAAMAALAALVFVVLPVTEIYSRIIFGSVIGTTLYAMRWAAGAVHIIQDLSWHFGSFSDLSPEEKATLRANLSAV